MYICICMYLYSYGEYLCYTGTKQKLRHDPVAQNLSTLIQVVWRRPFSRIAGSNHYQGEIKIAGEW